MDVTKRSNFTIKYSNNKYLNITNFNTSIGIALSDRYDNNNYYFKLETAVTNTVLINK